MNSPLFPGQRSCKEEQERVGRFVPPKEGISALIWEVFHNPFGEPDAATRYMSGSVSPESQVDSNGSQPTLTP